MRSKLNAGVWNNPRDSSGVAPPQRSDPILLGRFKKKFDGPLDRIGSVGDLKVNLRPEGHIGSQGEGNFGRKRGREVLRESIMIGTRLIQSEKRRVEKTRNGKNMGAMSLAGR